jgi:hypothetical protein
MFFCQQGVPRPFLYILSAFNKARTKIFVRGEDNKVFAVTELEEELALEWHQVVLDLAAVKTCF